MKKEKTVICKKCKKDTGYPKDFLSYLAEGFLDKEDIICPNCRARLPVK